MLCTRATARIELSNRSGADASRFVLPKRVGKMLETLELEDGNFGNDERLQMSTPHLSILHN